MRGTLDQVQRPSYADGIIPAYAGNTSSMALALFMTWDHPRVCGEHSVSTLKVSNPEGSSPRMRGTRTKSALQISGLGIIPAYAGNTPRPDPWTGFPGDHPRVCGEHDTNLSGLGNALGSSPRMRGTH